MADQAPAAQNVGPLRVDEVPCARRSRRPLDTAAFHHTTVGPRAHNRLPSLPPQRFALPELVVHTNTLGRDPTTPTPTLQRKIDRACRPSVRPAYVRAAVSP